MCGTLVVVVRGLCPRARARAFIGRYMLGPFFVDMHTTTTTTTTTTTKMKKVAATTPFLLGDGREREGEFHLINDLMCVF